MRSNFLPFSKRDYFLSISKLSKFQTRIHSLCIFDISNNLLILASNNYYYHFYRTTNNKNRYLERYLPCILLPLLILSIISNSSKISLIICQSGKWENVHRFLSTMVEIDKMATERESKARRIESVTSRGMRMSKRSSSIDFRRSNSLYTAHRHHFSLLLSPYHFLYQAILTSYIINSTF